MPAGHRGKTTFSEVFKSWCSESDLGPISLNWFEELSSEAPPYNYETSEDHGSKTEELNYFKTPQRKPFVYNQLASTPLIFKEQNVNFSLYSPLRGPDHCKLDIGKDNAVDKELKKNHYIMKTKLGQANDITSPPLSACLSESPMVLQGTYRTPQREKTACGNLFYTPKLMKVNTPKHISESLGAEVDPDMSWSSSLATPPTLSSTVLIVRDGQTSGPRIPNNNTIMLEKSLSQPGESPKRFVRTTHSVPHIENTHAEGYVTTQELEKMIDSFDDGNNFEDHSEKMMSNLPNVLEDKVCNLVVDIPVEDVIDPPVKDDSSFSFPVYKMGNLRKVKLDKSRKKYFKIKTNESEETKKLNKKDKYSSTSETELEYHYPSISKITKNEIQNPIENVNGELLKDDVPSSATQWSQLNLSDLDVTQIEKISLPQASFCDQNSGERSANSDNECSSLSPLISVEISVHKKDEGKITTPQKENVLFLKQMSPKISPLNSVFNIGQTAEESISMDGSSFCTINTNITTDSKVLGNKLENPKSFVNDIICPKNHGSLSPNTDGKGSCPAITKYNSSPLNSTGIISQLKKKTKKFIYIVNDDSSCQGEQTQTSQEIESNYSASSHVELNSAEVCPEFTNPISDFLDSSVKRKCLQCNLEEQTVSITSHDKTMLEDYFNENSFPHNEVTFQDMDFTEVKMNRGDLESTVAEVGNQSQSQERDHNSTPKTQRASDVKEPVLPATCLLAPKQIEMELVNIGQNTQFATKNRTLDDPINSIINAFTQPPRDPPEFSVAIYGEKETLCKMKQKLRFRSNSDSTFITNKVGSEPTVSFANIHYKRNQETEVLNEISGEAQQVSAEKCKDLSPVSLGIQVNKNAELFVRLKDQEKVFLTTEKTALEPYTKEHLLLNKDNVLFHTIDKKKVRIMDNSDDNSGQLFETNFFCLGKSTPENSTEMDYKQTVQDLYPEHTFSSEVAPEFIRDSQNKKQAPKLTYECMSQCKNSYSKSTINTNVKSKRNEDNYLGKWEGNFEPDSNKNFSSGFKTASNKEIILSEHNIKKGKLFFKDIEQHYNSCSFLEQASAAENNKTDLDAEKQIKNSFPAWNSEASHSKSKNVLNNKFVINKKAIVVTREDLSSEKDLDLNSSLTASQKAEITELSTILEETGSQFEFTQFRKPSPIEQTLEISTNKKGKELGNLNVYEFQNIVEPDGYFAAKNEINNSALEQVDLIVCSEGVINVKQKTVDLPKINSGQVTSTDIFTENEMEFKGFCSALGRKMHVSNKALQKAMKLFSDIEEIGEEKPLQNFRNYSLDKIHKSNIVPTFNIANNNEDFKGKDAKCVYKPQNNVENNTGIFVEENIVNCSKDPENKKNSCPLPISLNKNNCKLVVPNSNNNCQREVNSLLLTDQQNIQLTISNQLIKQENYQIEEELLDLTCLEEAIKDEEMFTLNINEEDQLVSNQKEQKIREKENSYELQHFQTASGRNIIVSKESFNKVTHLFAEECSVKELNNFSFPLILEMPNVVQNESTEPSPKEGKNLVESETEEIALEATKNQLMSIQQGPKMENKKWKEHSMMGFHTASGKKVIISNESLAKVKHFFVAENLENDVTNLKNLETEFFKKREKVSEKHRQTYEMVELNAQVWGKKQSYQDDDEKVLVSVTTADLPKTADSILSNEPSNSVLFEEKLTENKESKENCRLSNTKQSASLPVGISGLGFYTGHGKSISVSEASLLKARKRIRERDLEDLGGKTEASSIFVSYVNEAEYFKADSDVHVKKLMPLNTLNNISSIEDDKNHISEKQGSANLSSNLSNIKCNLKHDTESSDFYHSDNADFFPEQISDKAMSCLKAKPPAFTTASGKKVHISNEAVQKAREMLKNDCDKFLKPDIETKSENNEMEIVKDFSKALDGKKRNMSTTDIFVSNKKCSKLIQLESISTNTESELDSELSHCQIKSKTSDLYQSTLGRLPNHSSSVGIFCTANGKPVEVSDNSLKKARRVFSEIENNSEKLLSKTSLGSENHPETLIEENAMLRTKTNNLPQKKDLLNNMVNLHNNSGFSTASGKQVLISENALKKVKSMLVEFDFMKNECSLEHLPESTENNTSEALYINDSKIPKHIVNSKSEEPCNKDLNLSNCNIEINSSENNGTTKVSCDQFKQDEIQSPLGTKLTPAKEVSFLKKEDGLKNVNMEGDGILEGIPVKRILQVSSDFKASENSLEREAMEIAKAFLQDDELTDSELPHNAKRSFFAPKNKEECMQLNSRFGKRRMEKCSSYGEPPIKRKLLHEFDRAVEKQEKSLNPSKSSPDGTMKDRQMFMHHIPLKPVTCDPFSTTKERQEMRHPNFTAPDQGFTSKSPFLKCQTLEKSSYKSFLECPLYKVSSEDNGKMKTKSTKVFVPPFKTKSDSFTDEQYVSQNLKLKVKEDTQENEKQKYIDGHNMRDSENNENYLTDKDNYNQETTGAFEKFGDSSQEMIENLQNAREMQDMRIKKKQTQQIHPQEGSLYLTKTSTIPKISLQAAVEGKVPSTYSSKQLYMYGVSKQCLRINSKNAESFKFHCQDYFSKEYLLDGNGIQLADGGWLIPTDEGKLGKEEFYRALCDTPGVDPKLITKTWVYNHYRWIIWKLAAMEFTFPKEFASRCLTPERVLLQLKYRYDIEIDKSRRSAIKKIMERDETAAKTLVLCVSEIISSDTNTSVTANNKKNEHHNVDTKKQSAVIEVTDGWYAIKALLDTPLLTLLQRSKLTVGQKIITHGAELIGSQEACTPLEAPASLMLKLSANSTRPACWYAKLGFFSDPRPFPLPLSTLFGEGGNVGCVDVVIQRVYPTQWMEKTSSGLYIFRNERAEEKEALKHAECQQRKLEALLTKIQAEFEKHEENSARQHGLSRILTRQQVRALQDGADLYEAVKNSPDPAYIEGCFNKEQLRTLNNHRQMLNDKKQAQLHSEFRKAIATAELEEQGLSKRDVTMVWKLRVINYEKQEKESVILSIWRPLSDIYSLLKEGNRYRIYHLATSPSKSKSDRARIRLTATKKTQYQQLPVSHETLFQVYQPREALPLSKLMDPFFQPPCNEVDIVGYVVFITKNPGEAPLVYLSDEYYNLLAVKFWIDLNEDVIKLHTLIAASNLQWKAESRSGIPTLFAGEFSSFSASPKEGHFQEMFNKLKSSVENIVLFCNDAENKLTHLLSTHNSKQPSAVKEYNIESPSPQARLDLGHVISTPHSEQSHHCPEGNSGLTTSSFKITPTSDCRGDRKMDDPKICKKRRSLDFFSRLPLPPPISQICTFVSPAAQKAFQPPRSCSNNKPIKKNTLNSPQMTTLKTLSGTSMVENDLIADEELALINTQALLSNSSE
ncbi:breast cancer type 2 susceptibility protein isoform X2 [Macrotis lagotis]|uniref:breast cancer type 2 susceptibility protein isoform X2 n=1 Tax=Macrotis lagotis TaxID=92651 RepID=UPI003D69C77F